MSAPLVTVVTPSYNQAEFLEDTLVSVLEQSGPPVEHVVVDGGSTDGSVDLLEAYEDRYDLRWVSESDEGQSDAVNKGIEMATGEWLCWINSDDYLLPGAIESFADARAAHPESDFIYGDFVFVDADGNEIGKKYNTKPSKFVHKYWYQFTGNHSSFFKREVMDALGGVDEDYDYAMDTDLFWRLLETDFTLTHVPVFFGARRLHEAAKTTGEPPAERRQEIARLEADYPTSAIESVVPKPILSGAAMGLQSLYHLTDGRPEALAHL